MAEKNSEKINFNIAPSLKSDIEFLAYSHGKTLSAFMLEVCKFLVSNNKERIERQKQLAAEPINFTSPVAQSDSKLTGGDDV